MYQIKTLNKISQAGLQKLDAEKYTYGDDVAAPNGILVRSADMKSYAFNPELLCIARAGAGVNNIPVSECADRGIVVFNTPGANANAVKELVLCAMLLSSRKIVDGITWLDREMKFLSWSRREKASLSAQKSAERNWALLVWAQLALWLPTQRLIWAWRSMAMTRIFL